MSIAGAPSGLPTTVEREAPKLYKLSKYLKN